jgi:hypothetical protein
LLKILLPFSLQRLHLLAHLRLAVSPLPLGSGSGVAEVADSLFDSIAEIRGVLLNHAELALLDLLKY